MPMIDLAGTWASPYIGWQHFAPLGEQQDDESWDEYTSRLTNVPPMVVAFAASQGASFGGPGKPTS